MGSFLPACGQRLTAIGILVSKRQIGPHGFFVAGDIKIWLGLILKDTFESISAVSPEIKQTLLHPDIWKELGGYDTAEVFRNYYNKAGGTNPMARIQYVDVKTYLTDDILVKVDRASMANSLEVRAPMLDGQFMELAARIPTSLSKGTLGRLS
ncbi:MAG: asparagine synthase-related protein [Nitrospirales bacterium]|nr:asparagine synthase C-terminal domain-containing protein [Nitrospirales bacterium]